MRKSKKLLALLTALSISASAFAGFATTAFAEDDDVYYTLDFEEDKTYVNNTDTAPSSSVTELWQSQYYAAGLSIATDSENSGINKYAKYLNNQGKGTRCATYFLPGQAQTLDEDQRAVVEFDFQFHNGGTNGNNQIVLVGNTAMPIQNGDYEPANKPAGTAPILKMTQPKDGEGEFFINNSGTGLADATAKSTGYKNDTWAHAKVVMNFTNKTILLTITSLDGETTYFEPAQLPMGSGQDATKLYSLHVAAARDSSYVAMDNVVVRQLRDGDLVGTYYNVTFDVDGKQTIMSGKENDTLPSLPNTAKTGYIFDGWHKNDDTENLISSETLLATPLTEDVKYTAVYHRDSEYIEPMVSLEFSSFPDGNIPTAGADANTAADNIIQVKINGEIGGNLGGADFDERVTDLDVEWEFKGFRHIASKAAEGEDPATADGGENKYCDSYAEVVYDEEDPTKVNFKLKSQAFNFYGEVVATVTYNGETMTIKRPMAILPTNTTDANTLLPKQHYLTNFDWYADDMVDYQAATSADNKAMVDVVTGGWAASGGNNGRGLYLVKDEETDKKYMKLKSTGTNSSSFAVNKLDNAPTGQVVVEQDIRFYNAGSSLLFKQDNPVTWSENATSFSVNFSGTALDINGSKIADAQAGVWYKIVASADVTSKLCYAKLYDMEGHLLGESDIVPFTKAGATAPTYLCYRTPDNSQGELDFNNVKMYVPQIDGELTTTISNDTLIIPTDIVLKDGINYDGENKKVIVKKDLPDDTKATLIAATYKGEVLLKTSASELTFKDGQASVDMEVSGATKLMVWDSLEGMQPLCDVKAVEGSASGVENTATLTVDARSTEGYNIISNAEWTVVDEGTGEASEFVTITADANNSHNATLTVAKGAAAGTYNVTVSLGGKQKTIPVTVTGTQDSVKFTKSTSSIGIPLEEGASQTYEYSAIAVDSENNNLNKPVTYAMYDKNNVNPLANTEAISFNADTGVLTVTSAAEGTVIYIRAMSTNSEDKPITRSLKVTIHGLAFDLGSATDVAEGYTAVSPATTYNEQAGYGIEGTPTVGGEGTLDNADSDNLAGTFTFKAKVPASKVYKVTVKYTGTAVAEKYNADLTGIELASDQIQKEGESFLIPVIDDVLDLTFSGGNVSSIVIEKTPDKAANLKPHIYTVGDSTIANNGSWAYVMNRDYATYTDLADLASFSNNGRGSKNLGSYYTGGEFTGRVLTNICPGDYVMIGDMGTNGEGSKFEESFNYYIDACEALGAKVILNSYSPHGAVNGDKTWYDSATQTFNGWRQDNYDNIVRKIYEERITADGEKYDANIIGFVEIGKNADASFNAYVDDFADNGHASRDDAAKAIYSCFTDHNHYSAGPLACQLMIEGYGDVKGIVAQLVDIISADLAK